MISKELQELLKKQHYGLAGKHSAVQICRWTKKSLVNEGYCYKQKFYGIESHRCVQMTPSVAWCQNECLHCWRAIDFTLGKRLEKSEVDNPKGIIRLCINEQRRLLNGFKGNKNINMKKFQEAQEPRQFAISLAGEPTLYPLLGDLIKELRKGEKTSFLVTNGLMPERLLELKKRDALPTQLYISLNSPNKKMYDAWHRSALKNAWQRFSKSLGIMKTLETRRVLRMTLVRNLNMIEPENYAKLIKKAEPDFVEVKAYMAVGFARQRLGYERMPLHTEIKEFAEKIARSTKLEIIDEKQESRVIVLGKSKEDLKIKEI